MQEKSSLKFSDRLRSTMLASGVKLSGLAANAGISKGYLSGLLSGQKESPSFEVVKKIADVLRCSPAELLYGVQEDQESATIRKEEPVRYLTAAEAARKAKATIEPEATIEDAMALMRQALRIMEEIQRKRRP